MTAADTTPDVDITSLPDIDAEVACEGSGCTCPKHQCQAAAVWRLRVHGVRTRTAQRCGDHQFLMCDRHLSLLRNQIAIRLARMQGVGIPRCGFCGREFRHLTDVILEVTPL